FTRVYRAAADGTGSSSFAASTGDFDLFFDAHWPLITQDGSHLVFQDIQRGDDDNDAVELYASKSGAASPVLLADDYTFNIPAKRFVPLISPDGARVVFLNPNRNELYTVPIEGGSPPVRLDVLGNSDLQISPDSQRVVYRARNAALQTELRSVLLDGSQAARTLNGPLVSGGGVFGFAVTPDSARVLYRANQDASGVIELFSVPVDGSAAPVKLSSNMVGSVVT